MTLFKRARFFLWYFGRFKVPLIGYVKPKLVQLDDMRAVIKIPYSRRSKNHLNSLYFGALAIGADLAGGMHGLYYSKKLQLPISLAFKTFEAKFLKRAESDVYFISEEGEAVKFMIEEAQSTKKRVNRMIAVKAFINYQEAPEEIACFNLELSIKISNKSFSIG